MRTFGWALGFWTLGVLLASCGGPQSPIAGPGGVSLNAPSAGGGRAHSWMDPQAQAKSLLYVSSVLTGDVYVYSYSTQKLLGNAQPDSRSPMGSARTNPRTSGSLTTELHRSSNMPTAAPVRSPRSTIPGEYPEGCSVDPTTGNLAVTNFYSTSGAGSVSIYAGARGTHKSTRIPV